MMYGKVCSEFVYHNQKCYIPKARGKGRILNAPLKVGDPGKEDLGGRLGNVKAST